MKRPIIAITMGDAAGVGPEIIMKMLIHRDVYERCKPLVIGDAKRLRRAGEIIGSTHSVQPVAGPQEAAFEFGAVDCIDLDLIPADLPWGNYLQSLATVRSDTSSGRSNWPQRTRPMLFALLR
ncbi:hypothetical protein ACFQY9_33920 [Microvirga aerilata]|uniref:hypothetical protein n=1 Tax=Microvirga aerilata TaxID=670292 RepID=UPI003629E58E